MALAAGPIINVWTDLEQNRAAGPIINVWTDLEQNRAAGPNFQFLADIGALQLQKGKQVAKSPLATEGVVAEHVEPGALRADAVGRALVENGFFDAATVASKFAASSIPTSKIIGGGGASMGCVYALTADFTVPDNAFTPVAGWTEIEDDGSPTKFYIPGTSTTDFVVPVTGRFGIATTLYWNAGGSASRFLAIKINGVLYRLAVTEPTGGGQGVAHSGFMSKKMTAGQIIQVIGYQASGGGQVVAGDVTGLLTKISIALLP